jgi:hypothetical protein
MRFYVYRALERALLADDEKSRTPSMFDAAAFTSQSMAEKIAQRELGRPDTTHTCWTTASRSDCLDEAALRASPVPTGSQPRPAFRVVVSRCQIYTLDIRSD